MNNKVSMLLTLSAFLILSTAASAVPSFYPYYQRGAQEQVTTPTKARSATQHTSKTQHPSPAELLKQSISKTMAFLSQSQTQPQDYNRINQFVMTEMAPHFDFRYMARWIAGRYYQSFSPEQKKRFTHTFQELFISTLVHKLSQYQPTKSGAEVFRSRRVNANEAIANVQIMRPKQQKINVDFRFYKTPQGWKVIDVKANGISALMYYRRYFSEKIRQRRG